MVEPLGGDPSTGFGEPGIRGTERTSWDWGGGAVVALIGDRGHTLFGGCLFA